MTSWTTFFTVCSEQSGSRAMSTLAWPAAIRRSTEAGRAVGAAGRAAVTGGRPVPRYGTPR